MFPAEEQEVIQRRGAVCGGWTLTSDRLCLRGQEWVNGSERYPGRHSWFVGSGICSDQIWSCLCFTLGAEEVNVTFP